MSKRWQVWVLWGQSLMMVACVSSPATEPVFTKFPPRFRALQVVRVEAPGHKLTLLANLERQGKDINVTFLHPLMQVPVLGLAEQGGKQQVTRYMDLPDMPFSPTLILDAIQDLYQHESFARRSSFWGGTVYEMETKTFRYELSEIEDQQACVFPRQIRLQAKGQVKVRLAVQTKEQDCGAATP